jgi:hypothetical protein
VVEERETGEHCAGKGNADLAGKLLAGKLEFELSRDLLASAVLARGLPRNEWMLTEIDSQSERAATCARPLWRDTAADKR